MGLVFILYGTDFYSRLCKLSDAVLAGEFNPGDTAVVDLNDDHEIKVTCESPLPLAPEQKK